MTWKPAEGPHLLEKPTPNLNSPKRVQAHYCLCQGRWWLRSKDKGEVDAVATADGDACYGLNCGPQRYVDP